MKTGKHWYLATAASGFRSIGLTDLEPGHYPTTSETPETVVASGRLVGAWLHAHNLSYADDREMARAIVATAPQASSCLTETPSAEFWRSFLVGINRPPRSDDEEVPEGVPQLVPWWTWRNIFEDRYGAGCVERKSLPPGTVKLPDLY